MAVGVLPYITSSPTGITAVLPVMRPVRKTFLICCGLLLVHGGVLLWWGTKPPGPSLSDLIQLVTLIWCAVAALQASSRTSGLVSTFWSLGFFSFSILSFAVVLETYSLAIEAHPFIPLITSVLFVFWYAPLTAVLFLDADYSREHFDHVHLFDIAQVFLFWIAVYLCFSSTPAHPQNAFDTALSSWKRNLIYDAVLSGGFLLRSALTRRGIVRRVFFWMGLFFLLAGAGDAYWGYPGKTFQTGNGFDIVWCALNMLPLLLAVSCREAAKNESPTRPVRRTMDSSPAVCCRFHSRFWC